MSQQKKSSEKQVFELPLLPLRDVVVYPQMVIPLFVGREKSIHALEAAMAADKKVLLLAQKDPEMDDPDAEDLYSIGTQATILQLLRLPDGTVKVLIEGEQRARLLETSEHQDYNQQNELVEYVVATAEYLGSEVLSQREQEVLTRVLLGQFEQYVKLSKKVPNEVLTSLQNIEDPTRMVDTISSHMSLGVKDKQELLELDRVRDRIERLMSQIEEEIDLLQVEKRIRSRVKQQMEKTQREYYLNEQMKAIQKEMGDLDNAGNEIEQLTKKIEDSGMSAEARDKAKTELNKLKMMSPTSAEATVVRGYLDWMVSLPWKKRSRASINLEKAGEILDADHYGLEEVKERILDYLAVQQRVKKIKGSVLCLVGPPGVGKTSLGQSIARAVNRKYIRMALGGVRDEAEIRGHRRTYIGSMPGKLVQKLSKVGVRNPLFLLDEIDKLGMDHRGDPASALLEVLDPEQNSKFSDHYLEVDFDLSEVLFICTANSMNIPAPLLDRMEVVRLPGYTEDEKSNIAERYLLPKQMKNAGLKDKEANFQDSAILEMIRYYTREAGVRELERQITRVCRKVVREISEGKVEIPVVVGPEEVEHYLGVRKYSYGLADQDNQVGRVTGLAWTSVGGELLSIEAAIMPGKARLVKTGSLGEVMQESIQAALTVVRSRSAALGIDPELFEKKDIHIHVPEGATPKDGPSAGISMCTALVSAFTGIPVRSEVAMTGEINLRGEVMQIGGLKEKLLAARRGGIKTVLIPQENERDLKEIPESIKGPLQILPVKWIDQVLEVALTELPEPFTAQSLSSSEEKTGDLRPGTH
ncbi:ATP-dependent Lon protease [Marinospirillum celere]|uniref:Lon protease n=1 Tax=Marinospirillum celere TaxID=1122252 RepID=A0A1I1E6J6_9GAMM|nr:endopeptidase La [Marinospirillum celere]SFB82819.1 ATP-dependent Lon protease [Marinospirillum celere]